MDNKFEILDSACQTTDDSEDDIYRWRQKTIKTINHPIQTMVNTDSHIMYACSVVACIYTFRAVKIISCMSNYMYH